MNAIPLVDLSVQHAEVARRGAGRVRTRSSRPATSSAARRSPPSSRSTPTSSVPAHCVGVGNGTDALELALRAVGVGHGDEVVAAGQHLHRHRRGGRARRCPPGASSTSTTTACSSTRRACRGCRHATEPRAVVPRRPLRPGGPLRAAAAHARRPGDRRASRTAPSPRARPGTGASAGTFGADRRDELLPRQEPRRLRRRRRGAHRRRATSPSRSGSWAPTAARRSTCTAGSASTRGSTPCRPWCCGPSCAGSRGWNEQRREAAARYDRLLAEALRRPASRCALPGNEHVWHLYVVRVREPRRRAANACRTTVSVPASTTRCRCTSPRRWPTWVTAAVTSR